MHGAVTVELTRDSATAELDRGDAAVLRVHDTGIGIDAEDLPRVFDRFYRGERAREREPGGAGLGLALVRWIVTAHDGTIACTSEPDSFTAFVVRLPLHATEPAQPRSSSARRHDAPRRDVALTNKERTN
jgi:signal transduction histidine kinase